METEIQQQKSRTHERILESAAKLMRRNGAKGASVAKVMKDAGLTVGGFYAHFDTKETLIEEAFRWALKETAQSTQSMIPPEATGVRKLMAYIKGYLSPQHRDRDRDGKGCPLAAMAVELGKGSDATRKIFSAELHRLIGERIELFSDAERRLDKKEFLGILSTLVGGLILARATRGSLLSEDILSACQARLIPPEVSAKDSRP